MSPLEGLFPDIPQAYGARRNVTDSFMARGGANDRRDEVDPQIKEIWIQDKTGKGVFKRLDLKVGFYNDATSVKAIIGSSVTFSADCVLIVPRERSPTCAIDKRAVIHATQCDVENCKRFARSWILRNLFSKSQHVMIGITTVGLDKFQRILGHIENGVPRVVSRAMNRAVREGRTELSRCTRSIYTIKQKDLYATLFFKNAGGSSMEAGIESRFSGMLPLAQFNVRPRARRKKQIPLSVNVRTGGGGTLGRAFWGNGKVLARRGRTRLPLTELKTISAPIMVSQPEVSEPALKAISESYEKRADHEIGRLLAEAG